jgi:hypothetical protein
MDRVATIYRNHPSSGTVRVARISYPVSVTGSTASHKVRIAGISYLVNVTASFEVRVAGISYPVRLPPLK